MEGEEGAGSGAEKAPPANHASRPGKVASGMEPGEPHFRIWSRSVNISALQMVPVR